MMKTFNKIISLIIMIAIISSLSVNVAFASGEANAASQTFYPKDISGITFTGASNKTGYVKTDANGNITSDATKTIQSGVTYYKDDKGNYAFSARHDGNTKGCINIPVNVTTAGKYDVTVNYYISPVVDNTYKPTTTTAWLVKANDQILAYTNVHCETNGASNTDKTTFNAGTADFTQGVNTISFELSSLEQYARRIIIESIVLTPKKDRTFFVNPDSLTINSKSDIVSKSIAYNGKSEAPYVVTKFETTSAPTVGETYIEFTLNAPFDGNYTIAFDKVGAVSGTYTGGMWNVSVNNGTATLVDFTRNYKSIKTVSINSALKKGINTLKFVYDSTGNAKQDYGFFLTGINLNYIPKDKIEVVNAPALFGEAPVPTTQTFYPKDISDITFEGVDDRSGFVKLDKNGNISDYATKTIEEETAYYIDADGNYAFSAKHDGATKGCINIPIDVTAAGNYDVTVNYYISPVGTYKSTSAWLVKANEQILAYTKAHGTNGASNTDKMVLEAGSADFSQGKNTISFELTSLEEKYARRIIIESIVLTPNSDRAFYVNPDSITVNSKSDIVSKSIEYNGMSAAPYVVTKYETTSAPTAGETYIEFAIKAPFDGNYTIAFDKVGAVSGTYTGGMWNVSVNNGTATLVDFTRNYKSIKTVSINSALKKGINTLKFVYDSTGNAKQDYGFFLTGITVTPDAADIPEIADIVISTMPEAGTYQARATIKNDTSKDETAVIIAAVYGKENNKDDLKNIDYVEYSVEVGETKEISTPVIVPEGITEGWIKLFVWSDIDDKITPIIRSTIIK